MGYEHKLIFTDGINNGNYQRIIAEVDISRHDVFLDNLKELFPEKLDGYIYINDEERTTDYYGNELHFTRDLKKLANWLEADNDKSYYRRLPHVIALLRAFNKNDWEDLKVIHFGH